MDFRVLKYFPFGGAKRLDVVAEFFQPVQRRERLPDQCSLRLRLGANTRI